MYKTKVISFSLTPAQILYLKELKSTLDSAGTISAITVSDIISALVNQLRIDHSLLSGIVDICLNNARKQDAERRMKQKYIYNRRKKYVIKKRTNKN